MGRGRFASFQYMENFRFDDNEGCEGMDQVRRNGQEWRSRKRKMKK